MNKIIGIILVFFSKMTFAGGDPLRNSIETSTSAMHAQSKRLEIIAENIANSNSTGLVSGSKPYKRKIVVFKEYHDQNNVAKVKIFKVTHDNSEFKKKYDPNHPAADNTGYVLYPNVSSIIESADAREAQRSYNANLNSIEIARNITSRTLDILR